MPELSAEIRGMEELQKKMDKEDLLSEPMKRAFAKAAITVQNQAKLNATGEGVHARGGPNVVTGLLRASITHVIDASPIPEFAQVKSDVLYAAPVEFGSSRWASGVKYPFLYPALEQSKEKVDQYLQEAANAIEENFSK